MEPLKSTVVEYVKMLHTDDALTGSNGQCLSETNPPAYKKGEVCEIRKVGEYHCCVDMRHHFRNGHIGFGSRPKTVYKNKSTEIFIRAEGEDIPLAYCPWCKSPVLTFEVTTCP